MKVLGISGSPRLGGNTDQLLAEAMRGAHQRGAETKTLYVCDMDIRPCHHCAFCYSTGECKTADDMITFYEELEQADRLIIASPLYFMSVTAQLKALIDRGQSRWARKFLLKVPPMWDSRERKALFLCVGGMNLKNQWQAIETTIKAWLVCHDIKLVQGLTYSNIDNIGAIKKHPTALIEAFAAGQKLVE